MKPNSLTKLAAVSALALGVALYAGTGNAIDVIGVPQTITINATTQEALVVSDVEGEIFFSATGDATDLAEGGLDADGATLISDAGTGVNSADPASLVVNANATNVWPSLTLVAATDDDFNGADLYISVDPDPATVVDLTCDGADILITSITDDSDDFTGTQMEWVRPVATGVGVQNTVGIRPFVADSALDNIITFGFLLSTNTGTAPDTYGSAVCTDGTFDIVVVY